jgi:hypothetical protein
MKNTGMEARPAKFRGGEMARLDQGTESSFFRDF